MAKFRKKSVIVDGWPVKELLKSARGSWRDLPEPIKKAYEAGNILFRASAIDIKTLKGWMFADASDIIIQGVANEFYPFKPDIFEATYEPVDD